jgi:hypothetical protein
MKHLIKRILKEVVDDLELKDYPKSKTGWKLDQLNWFRESLPNMPNYVIMDLFAKKNEKPYDKEEMLNIVKQFGKYKWVLKKNFPMSLDIFTDETIKYIKEREGGSKNPMSVPNDVKRHQFQKEKIKSSMPTEPIILLKEFNMNFKAHLILIKLLFIPYHLTPFQIPLKLILSC